MQAAYAFLWQAYREQYVPPIMALARQTQLLRAGEQTTLDGSRSWVAEGKIVKHEWLLEDGSTKLGAVVQHIYPKPGSYHEILKITDSAGNVDYDFQRVRVIDPRSPKQYGPRLHPTYWPTFGIKAGDPVTFKVRSFQVPKGESLPEEWDFGDGSPTVKVQSDGGHDPPQQRGVCRDRTPFCQSGSVPCYRATKSKKRKSQRGAPGCPR